MSEAGESIIKAAKQAAKSAACDHDLIEHNWMDGRTGYFRPYVSNAPSL